MHGRFPKSKRYTLGQRCDDLLIDALESVVRAAHSAPTEKSASLERSSAVIDTAKLLFRVAKDTRCITNEEYLTVQSKLITCGKMIGGWIRQAKTKTVTPSSEGSNGIGRS